METWPFTHCIALLAQYSPTTASRWLAELWDDNRSSWRPEALTPRNLARLELDTAEQQALTAQQQR